MKSRLIRSGKQTAQRDARGEGFVRVECSTLVDEDQHGSRVAVCEKDRKARVARRTLSTAATTLGPCASGWLADWRRLERVLEDYIVDEVFDEIDDLCLVDFDVRRVCAGVAKIQLLVQDLAHVKGDESG